MVVQSSTKSEDSKPNAHEDGRWRVSRAVCVRGCARERECFCGENNATNQHRDPLAWSTPQTATDIGPISGLGRGPPNPPEANRLVYLYIEHT